MAEGIVVDAAPVAMNEGADQKQQGALRLVEIGDEHLHNLVFITWGDDNLRAAVKDLLMITVEPFEDVTNGLLNIDFRLQTFVVGFPLVDVQLLGCQVGVGLQTEAYAVEPL